MVPLEVELIDNRVKYMYVCGWVYIWEAKVHTF